MFEYVSEERSAGLVDHDLARRAVADAFIAVTTAAGQSFPVLVGYVEPGRDRFTVKSGATAAAWGLKVGSYWPRNDAHGLPRHNSCILLFDPDTAQVRALIEARKANAYRTAAANALAVAHLARRDSSRLAIFGAGHQALFECRAVMRERTIREIFVVNRNEARSRALAAALAADNVTVTVTTAELACQQADIIVTATGATAPLFPAGAVRPGTHISSMGSDSVGKQELPVELLCAGALFCDSVEQSLRIGEFQHVGDRVRNGTVAAPTNLGEVLAGRHPGRATEDAITVFDSSGIALQDLFLGVHLLEKLRALR